MAVAGPTLTDDQRETALWVIDCWVKIAEQKDTEAAGAYAKMHKAQAALAAMTKARDLCKQQTADVEAGRQRLGQGFNRLLDHIHSSEHAGARLGCGECRALEAAALGEHGRML